MDKIIEALYFGNISPLNKTPNAKETELTSLLTRHKTALDQNLTPESKALFEKFADCYAELMTERELAVFKQGCKLGMCFTIEGTDIETK